MPKLSKLGCKDLASFSEEEEQEQERRTLGSILGRWSLLTHCSGMDARALQSGCKDLTRISQRSRNGVHTVQFKVSDGGRLGLGEFSECIVVWAQI